MKPKSPEFLAIQAEIAETEAKLVELRKKFDEQYKADGRAQPLLERMTFAAYTRCECGAGMAYDPYQEDDPNSPFKGPTKWECSNILLYETFDRDKKAEVKAAVHSPPMSFNAYEVKSENQPSANGATTRGPA